jgi:hypothetical protein
VPQDGGEHDPEGDVPEKGYVLRHTPTLSDEVIMSARASHGARPW